MPFFLIAFLKFKHKNRHEKSRSFQKKSGLKNIKKSAYLSGFYSKYIDILLSVCYNIINEGR